MAVGLLAPGLTAPVHCQQEVAPLPPAPEEIRQQIDSLQQRLDVLKKLPLDRIPLGVPGIGFNNPTAYGGYSGEVTAGIGLVNRTRLGVESDGIAGIVFSVGDPKTRTGLDIGAFVLDLSSQERGSFSFKLHHVLPNDWWLAIGVDNSLIWGWSDTDTSLFAVGTKRFSIKQDAAAPFSRLDFSLGIGGGRFRSVNDIRLHRNKVAVLGSASVNVSPDVNLFIEWSGSGKDVSIGASFLVSRDLPLVITPALADVTGNAPNGIKMGVGITYGFSF